MSLTDRLNLDERGYCNLDQSKKIRVLVADDSALMRKILSDILNSDHDIEVIDTARNGREAFQKVLALKPDVVTLDIEMPVMDGLATLELLMREHPVPVIILSALTQSGAAATISALQKGAIDFIAKPSGSISLDISKISDEIISKTKTAARIPALRMKSGEPEKAAPAAGLDKPVSNSAAAYGIFSIVAIGTSTGGPKALHQVMSSLPKGLNAGILIVQHMPPGFTKSLAQRLDSVSPFNVKEAEHGEPIVKGGAYVAPGNFHLAVNQQGEKLYIEVNQSQPVNNHRPSADVLFASAAKVRVPKVGVIMTGMGSDGAHGLKTMRDAGAVTIGENAETSVVYGMPKSAVKLGAVIHEVPLFKIADYIVQALKNA